MPTHKPPARPAAVIHQQQRVYSGRVIDLDLVDVDLPNGHRTSLELISHPGGAAVVALNEHQEVCLLYQYRQAAEGWLWEVPAGKLDGKPPEQTARAELAEEAGLTARDWRSLGTVVSSPGVFKEVVHLYLAQNLRPVPPNPEPSEVYEIAWVSLKEALRRALSGELSDAKSVIALCRAAYCVGVTY
jgi:8-oxo-dGTP pyrophosphatase MutT (NUDIX family)